MYIPGFSNMLMRPENQGAAANPPPSVQPSAPPIMAAPATQSPYGVGAMDLSALANLNINPVFMGGTGLGSAMPSQSVADLRIDPATGLTLNIPRTAELDETGRVVREITPEGSMPGMYFSDDRGMPATTGLGDDARFTALDPNAVYTVVNERTGEVVSEGVGAEGLKAAQLASSELSEGGRKADWAVVKTDPTTGATSAVANVDPRQSPLGKFADVVLPAALAFTPLGPVGGAALGSGVSSVAQGRSLGETLKRAAISGAAAGIGAGVGGKLGGALSKTAPSASGVGGTLGGSLAAAGPAAQAALNAALPGIVVPGALGSALGSALGTAAGAGLSGTLANMPAGRGADFADRVFEQPRQPVEITPEGDLVLTGTRPTLPTGFDPGSIAPVLPNLIPSVATPTPDVSPEIVVERAPTSFEEPPAVIPPVAPDFTNLPQPDVSVPEPEKSLGDKLKDRLSNLGATDYMRLAALGIGLVGGGGGNRGALGTIPGGFGSGFAPVFGGGLPAPTLPGATGNFAPRTAADLRPQTTQDWYRYGYGPEQSFFDYVPEGEENKSQAFTGYAFGGEVGDLTGGLGMGGGSYAVNGPGTGRSDEIPALLSDGEYVMDAETVALLGDGSSKAGAERLDQLRVKIRKDKGRNLAKGEFSVNAKHPEHYLKGGRV